MSTSKTLLLLPVASLLVAGAIGSGACTSSTTVTIPPSSNPPPGVTFVGGTFGGSCNGDIFVEAGTGYAFCDNGKWAYTTTDPSMDGYMPDTSTDGGSNVNDTGPADGKDQGNDGRQDDDGQGGGGDGSQGHGGQGGH